jgi:uncharacterized repeat protein (TIGR01451 family)
MMHQLPRFIGFLLLSLMLTATASAQLDCFGVDGGSALPGTPCDNGNVNNTGFPDRWTVDCVCHDFCESDVWGLAGYPGDGCDDGDPNTMMDIMWPGCICVGWSTVDCTGEPGSAYPGTPCDDGDPTTLYEVWTPYCTCETVYDCLGVEGGSNMPGTPCDDGDPNTFNEIWSMDCGCGIYGPNTIAGQVFLDVDQNGVQDDSDLVIYNRTVKLGNNGPYISSGFNGLFSINIGPGSYTLTALDGDFDHMGVPSPMVDFEGFGEVSYDHSLAMFADQDINDLKVHICPSPARPGFGNCLWVVCTNQGTQLSSGQVSITWDAQQDHYNNSTGGILNGNTITWDLPELQLGQVSRRLLYVKTPVNVPIGTELNHSAMVTTSTADGVPENNTYILAQTVVGSYDPNDKLVTPSSLSPQEIAEGKPVEYTIRFQNTGTYLAETVRIEDQLSEDLNLSTFEFLGSSHPCTWSINNGMLQFYFEQIMLPDSNANEPESHGFVMFRITPNSDLQLGDAVENVAAIYFDFNEPIITDPAVFVVETSTGVTAHAREEIRLWPNPSTGIISIEFNGSGGELIVLDMIGRPIHQQRVIGNITSVDVSRLATGNYIVRIDAQDGSYRSRFVKK